MRRDTIAACVAAVVLSLGGVDGRLADRSRIIKARQESGKVARYHDNGRPIEGPSYRSRRADAENEVEQRLEEERTRPLADAKKQKQQAPWQMPLGTKEERNKPSGDVELLRGTPQKETPQQFERKLSSQLTGCCYTYQSYGAESLCSLYGQDCESGETPSHDSGDSDCEVDGLSFIGISFSVNTASGNPYSYQLCDQFPMENIIDRDYDYVMSMDEDGWLVGGGYKTFDYSGKMP